MRQWDLTQKEEGNWIRKQFNDGEAGLGKQKPQGQNNKIEQNRLQQTGKLEERGTHDQRLPSRQTYGV
jgi:hypothetical protein